MYLGHLAIETILYNICMVLKAKETDSSQFFVNLLIQRKYATSFCGIEHLGGVEASYGNITLFEHAFTFIGSTY